MNSTLSGQYSLLKAIEGLRNIRAIALLGLGWVVFALINALGQATHSYWGILFFLLLSMLAMLYFVCAAGIVLIHVARGMPSPSFSDALFAAFPAFLNFLLIVLFGAVCFALYWLVVALLFFVCKIPGIGPVLYAVILPIAILITAAVLAGAYVALGLLGPAVWEGSSFSAAVAMLFTIAAKRPMETLVQFVLLALLVGLLAWAVFGLLFAATLTTGQISMAVLDVNVVMASAVMPNMLLHPGVSMGMDGYYSSGMYSTLFVFALASAAIFSVQLLGCNLIYLRMSEGLDAGATEAALRDRMAQAQRKAEQLQATAKERAQQMQERARQHKEESKEQEGTATCPACGAAKKPGTTFCGECGAKL